jgi:Holliday junction resolvase RusA-like endonuclease
MNNSTNISTTQALSLIILGEPASKANSRRMVHIRGKTMFIKSAKALAYAKSFKQQVESAAKVCFHGDVAVHITIYYASRRPDLDESLILDLLQDVAYENDRQVKEKHIYWGLDKENPRCEIKVEKIKGSL